MLEEKRLQGYRRKLLSFEKEEHKSRDVGRVGSVGREPKRTGKVKHAETATKKSTKLCIGMKTLVGIIYKNIIKNFL